MTSPALPDVATRRDLSGALKRLLQKVRQIWGGHEGWRSWFLEICILIVVILALSVVLQPRVVLMAASPHPFWLPVVAAALVHGTFPGLVAAVLSGICAWLFGPAIATTEDDFYDLMFRVFKEPVLWLFAAIVLGTFRDRIEEERQRLARERDEARDDLGLVVNHATALRARIDDLERAIVLAEVDPPPSRALVTGLSPEAASFPPSQDDIRGQGESDVVELMPRREGDEDRLRLAASHQPPPDSHRPVSGSPQGSTLAPPDGTADFSFSWACLWEATAKGWERIGCEGIEDLPDPGRLLRHFDQQCRIYDSRRAEDREIMPPGALLAVPVRNGIEPSSYLLIVGGGNFSEKASLEQVLHMVLSVADRLGASLLGRAS